MDNAKVVILDIRSNLENALSRNHILFPFKIPTVSNVVAHPVPCVLLDIFHYLVFARQSILSARQ